MNSKTVVANLIPKLEILDISGVDKHAFIGLDGYIDKIQRAVGEYRRSRNSGIVKTMLRI